jgi:hypothetical protein
MDSHMKRVVIESPLGGNFKRNIRYARLCALDCIRRGEAPYASHLLMTQFLNDANEEERRLGMEAGFAWGSHGHIVAVYQDFGISDGMRKGIKLAIEREQEIEHRNLPSDLFALVDIDVPSKTEGIE